MLVEQIRTQHIVNAIQETNHLFDRLDRNIDRINRQTDTLILGLVVIGLVIVIKDLIYYYYH